MSQAGRLGDYLPSWQHANIPAARAASCEAVLYKILLLIAFQKVTTTSGCYFCQIIFYRSLPKLYDFLIKAGTILTQSVVGPATLSPTLALVWWDEMMRYTNG